MRKFYVVEIEVMKNNTIAKAITERDDMTSAISQYHQTLASAVINSDIFSAYVEVIDNFGNVIKKEYWQVEEPTVEQEA